MLFALLGLHAVAGTVALAAGSRLGRRALLIGGVAPAATVVWALAHAGAVLDGRPVTAHASWVGGLGLDLDLRVDGFSLAMIALVAGIGLVVFAYAWWYLGSSPDAGRLAGLLTLFAGAMLTVVVADNVLLLFVGWELTSITSYLLIGVTDRTAAARDAAQHALLVTALGGLALLAGLIVLGQRAGTFRLSELLAHPPTGTAVSVALVLVLVGAFTKSAQYPFHSWLPGAMVAPTPISAYLHSAAMVKAGVYVVARFAPAFADHGIFRPLVVGVGLVTMVAGGLRALRPTDLKQLLAFGTISQLGFLMVLFGLGRPEATAAGVALLLSHALFKAALFLVVGIVDHQAGTRDLTGLPPLTGPGWRPVTVVAAVSAASMAAVPPLVGFIAKESAYAALVNGSTGDRLVLAGVVAGSVLTVAYSLRFVVGLVRPDAVAGAGVGVERVVVGGGAVPAAPGVGFVAGPVVLATLTVVFGLAPGLLSPLAERAASALDPAAHAHLALWHGVGAALILSLATLATGGALFALRRPVAGAQARWAPPVSGLAVYRSMLAGLPRSARWITTRVQRGSLPFSAAVVLAVAAVVPVAGLLSGPWWSGGPPVMGPVAHLPIAALLIGAALAATVIRRRYAAAILLGVVGYAMALLFVVQGAPDVALTQFAVETLSVVVFLLVLRRLPDRFEANPRGRRLAVRLAVSAAVGGFVLLVALATAGARAEPSVSGEMVARALPDGHGRNVVNVILVDIRGLDTVGEITVLAVAGIGIAALARAGQRPRRRAASAPAAPRETP